MIYTFLVFADKQLTRSGDKVPFIFHNLNT